ncbi:spore germination protein [Ectobacillus funiculus]|uniref:GerAB/ArcD/ProY family transporter n=1 Tax=Ectobacillus funiculus TaxID=137993 RepID=UPI00397A5F8E
MKQGKISALQLFYVMIGFEIGNSIIFGTAAGAKQDAWLAILLSMLCGLILMWIYTKLSDYYPGETLVQMLPKIIGKFLSYPLIVIYALYFLYLACTACRDFGELIASTILTETPMILVIGIFMVLIVYCLRGGIEAFGRMGEIVFPIYVLILVTLWILMLVGAEFDSRRLTPVLGNGIQPVLGAAFPPVQSTLTFPFGETVLITMLFPVLNNKNNIKKVGMATILIGGILLAVNSIIVISVLGPDIYGKEFFPFFTAAQMVSIADFLERFDALIIVMIVSGVFFKVGGWIYGSSIIISQLFKLKSNDSILIPLGVMVTSFSILLATSFIEHLEIALNFIGPYLHIPLQLVLPILLLGIAYTRKKFQA